MFVEQVDGLSSPAAAARQVAVSGAAAGPPDPMHEPSSPSAPPIPLPPSVSLWRSSSFRIGVIVAVVGHLLAASPGIVAAYSFIRYAAPDSTLIVGCSRFC